MATTHLAQVQLSIMWLHIMVEQPAIVQQVVKQHQDIILLVQIQLTLM